MVADKTTIIYDFAGKVTKSKTTHYQNVSTSVSFVDRPVYDHAGRVLQAYRQINSDPEKLLVQYVYNKLGQVVDKKLHDTGGSNFLQSVDMRYNIRGWLTSINNAQLTIDSKNDDSNDYFGMELAYNIQESGLSNTQYYNGNISAVKWKGPGTTGLSDQRSYKYSYDKSDRLKTATFQAHTGTAWTKEANTLNETMTYDHNGNIKSLVRNRNLRGNSGITITSAPETIDNLTYSYGSNLDKLTQVEDAATATGGFLNPVSTSTEYTYNTDGSQTKDDNKGISSITYNVLGKPQVVTYSGTPTKTITYTYDAGGNKLKMVTLANSVTTTTDYVGGFVYTNSALSFFSSPEGRVVKNGSAYEYQYAIADHQGNTRVVFSSATPAPVAVTATLEAATNTDFQNYTNRVGFNLFDHTDAGTTYTYAQKLTGGYNAQVGLAKSYKVYAGDQVKIEAWAKYQNPTSTSSNLAGFASALFAAFGVPAPGGGEVGTISSALNIWGGLVVGGSGGTSTGPKAFVNIIVFDKNYKLLDASWEAVDPAANQVGATPVIAHDYLMREYTAKEEGYVFMYVSNESATLVDVYFDDVVMTHTKGNVIQYNEYYPFGLQTANSWTRENTTGNDLLYNGKGLESTSQIYDYGARQYDPVLGRWNSVDELAEKYSSTSPYVYVLNTPVNAIDPDGRLVIYVNGLRISSYLAYANQFVAYAPPGLPLLPIMGVETRFRITGLDPPPWEHEQRIFDSDVYDYWKGFDDYLDPVIKTTEGEKSVYMDGMFYGLSNGKERFDRGFEEGLEYGENIKSRLVKNESVKIVGHSQGAAHAAGLAYGLLFRGIDVELAFFLAPHQPGDFSVPGKVYSFQFQSRSDKVSSVGLAGMLGSTYDEIRFVDIFIEMLHTNEALGGHMIETFSGSSGVQNFISSYGDIWSLMIDYGIIKVDNK